MHLFEYCVCRLVWGVNIRHVQSLTPLQCCATWIRRPCYEMDPIADCATVLPHKHIRHVPVMTYLVLTHENSMPSDTFQCWCVYSVVSVEHHATEHVPMLMRLHWCLSRTRCHVHTRPNVHPMLPRWTPCHHTKLQIRLYNVNGPAIIKAVRFIDTRHRNKVHLIVKFYLFDLFSKTLRLKDENHHC